MAGKKFRKDKNEVRYHRVDLGEDDDSDDEGDKHDKMHTVTLYGKEVNFVRSMMYDNRRRLQPREVVPKHVVERIMRACPASAAMAAA